MWKHVLPTQKWLLSQLSTILKSNLRTDPILNAKFAHLLTPDQTGPQPGASKKVPAKKFTGSSSKMPNLSKMKTKSSSSGSSPSESSDSDNDFDVNTDEDDNVIVNKVTTRRFPIGVGVFLITKNHIKKGYKKDEDKSKTGPEETTGTGKAAEEACASAF